MQTDSRKYRSPFEVKGLELEAQRKLNDARRNRGSQDLAKLRGLKLRLTRVQCRGRHVELCVVEDVEEVRRKRYPLPFTNPDFLAK
jgi:hypothetical protein